MEEWEEKSAEELAVETGEFSVTELDDKSLEDVSGGTEREIAGVADNTNCGCNGQISQAEPGTTNGNCGC
jgi:hypothetical protein